MAWIEVISHEAAKGLLKKVYDETVRRAGRIFNITSVMSQNPKALKGSLDFYRTLMFASSPLSRGQREMLAVVVSCANECHY